MRIELVTIVLHTSPLNLTYAHELFHPLSILSESPRQLGLTWTPNYAHAPMRHILYRFFFQVVRLHRALHDFYLLLGARA